MSTRVKFCRGARKDLASRFVCSRRRPRTRPKPRRMRRGPGSRRSMGWRLSFLSTRLPIPSCPYRRRGRSRAPVVALMHHPLGLEAGLTAPWRATIAGSPELSPGNSRARSAQNSRNAAWGERVRLAGHSTRRRCRSSTHPAMCSRSQASTRAKARSSLRRWRTACRSSPPGRARCATPHQTARALFARREMQRPSHTSCAPSDLTPSSGARKPSARGVVG